MPVRSINLKLVVPRRSNRTATAIWTTHEVINDAARYYEERLLAMRGRHYLDENQEVQDAKAVRERALGLLLAARERNCGNGDLDQDRALLLLRGLYESIVPAANGEDCNAQAANAYLSPLTDPRSEGFQSIFGKLDEAPAWVEGARNGEAEAIEAAQRWLQSEAGHSRLHATGSPPTWVRLARQADPKWLDAFIAKHDAYGRDAQGAPTLVRELKHLGVLPLFTPFVAPRLAEIGGAVTPWDRLAFRLAVGHLCSWESWNRKAAEDHTARRARVDRFTTENFTEEIRPAIDRLRGYEATRREELERIAFTMEGPFRISRRMVRGWNDLRERWRRESSPTEARLLELVAAEQTRRRGQFGDPHLFAWLARPENHAIWAGGTKDPLATLAILNAMELLVERSRGQATMTLPDPRYHPRSAQWEAPGGTNLKSYRLRQTDQGALRVSLPLLVATVNARLEEQVFDLEVAPSSQFNNPLLEAPAEGKKRGHRVRFHSSAAESHSGDLGAADLLLDWDHQRNREIDRVRHGDIGPVFLKLSLDLDKHLPEGWSERRPPAVSHFLSARDKPSRHASGVTEGLRVLSVDLGVRAFGACSVFELHRTRPDTAMAFSVEDLTLWAVHERSFLLHLPDERVDPRGERWREEARAELTRLRRALGRHRMLFRLLEQPPEQRELLLQALVESAADSLPFPFEPALLVGLEGAIGLPTPQWNDLVQQSLTEFRHRFGLVVREWRRQTRPRREGKSLGKSLWALDYLTSARRFLQSWSLAGRRSGDVRRLHRERSGVFAARLLEHMEGMRDDRLKTGADLIVQAARGYLRSPDGQWTQAHNPCQLVLFEDLTRYRMRTDRPRRENSQLMKWAHRSVPAEVAMQGEIYGIHVADTGAAFSSRFHAATRTPGIRCHCLRQSDIEDAVFVSIIERENPGLRVSEQSPGVLVPLSGGEVFVALTPAGVTRLHADINAAQNLQRRFWTRHRDPFRLPCSRVQRDGRPIWVPKGLGKRLLGGLGGYGFLQPTGHDSGSCRWVPQTPALWRRLSGAQAQEDTAGAEDIEELAGMEDEALERTGEVTVFFRDPSGVVLPADLWYPSVVFWSIVKTKTVARLGVARLG